MAIKRIEILPSWQNVSLLALLDNISVQQENGSQRGQAQRADVCFGNRTCLLQTQQDVNRTINIQL